MYNVTWRRISATIDEVEKKWVLHNLCMCICSLRYAACKAHAPYCNPPTVQPYNIFPHHL